MRRPSQGGPHGRGVTNGIVRLKSHGGAMDTRLTFGPSLASSKIQEVGYFNGRPFLARRCEREFLSQEIE